jgi:serine/threonine protein kinase
MVSVATLDNGDEIDYEDASLPAEGGMKSVYFTPDRKSAIAFFKDPNAINDRNRIKRLEAVIGRFNPTVGINGHYWKQLFCWPTAIVKHPGLGVVLPHYSTLPGTYFFESGRQKGREKEGSWFTSEKHRNNLLKHAPNELGNWKNFLSICILLSRAVRRLHNAGLAHSDLSNKNVLIDPTSGRCVVIDIDSLVVPGLFAPDVIGTPGYIAPEVLATLHLSPNDNTKKQPSVRTDLHALSVLLYEYLFFRHPLSGPKIYPGVDGREQELIEMGSEGLFVEHPTDHSNRPIDLSLTTGNLGNRIKELFERSFIDGLKDPSSRPSAGEWEKVLMQTWDLLHPCSNQSCWAKWFVLQSMSDKRCFHCHHSLKEKVPIMITLSKSRQGWIENGKIVVFEGKELYSWHVADNRFPGEDADRTPLGYFTFKNGDWYLVNLHLRSLKSPSGKPVPANGAHSVKMTQDATFLLEDTSHGRMAKIAFV